MKYLLLIALLIVSLSARQDTETTQAIQCQKGNSSSCELLDRFCSNNNAKSCNYLGVIYADGKGKPKNVNTAFKYYTKGCKLKSSQACLNAASILNIDKSYDLALRYYDISCKMGQGQACLMQGFYYMMGTGVKENSNLSKKYFKIGCDLGDKDSCSFL